MLKRLDGNINEVGRRILKETPLGDGKKVRKTKRTTQIIKIVSSERKEVANEVLK